MALTKEAAKNLSILSVAEQLGMELKRTGSYSYTWTEHDSFVINARKNDFHWNSRSEFGDVIQLVQTIQGVTYKEAMHFLETGEFMEVDLAVQTASREPFRYSLERYEHQDFKASRSYLKTQRGLSDDTINFFLSQGSMAEATRKKGDYFEPVIVFKYKDNTGFLAGASLQGIVENRVHYPERGRLKQIMRNSDGQLGFSVDIGKPKRLVFAEAPIDLMSYYELHKDRLQDVRLVAMDGVKEGIISRRFMELYAEMNGKSYQIDQNTGKALETVVNTTDYFKDGRHQDVITLAVDNDAAGQNFITRLQEKGIPVQIAIPPIVQLNQEKEDWNDFLKRGNEAPNELVHVYTADEESWHYQGYFSKEIAFAKAQELTADDVKAFVSAKQLTKEEVHQEYTRIVNQEKERENSMSEVHEARAEYKSERLEAIQDKVDGLVIQPETQALIDAGEVKKWAKQPNIYFVKGLRRVALELTEEGRFELSPKYRPNTDEEREIVNKLLSNQEKRTNETQKSSLTPDNSNLSPEDAEWLKQNWNNISFSVEPKKQMVIDSDKTVIFEKPSNPLGDPSRALEENQSTEKALGKSQELDVHSEYQKNERTNGSQGFLQPKAEGSPTPVPEVGTFERSVTSRPTLSSHLLYFSINEEFQSSNDGHYHSISSHELAKLNRPIRSQTIQNAAQYYLDELANSKIYYVTPDKTVQVNFEEKHFMHLTGIKPLAPGQTPEKTLRDFAEGNGHFDNILLANNDATFDKINVLSDLSVATESTSFYFDDLTNLRRYNGRFDSLIKSDDKDIILLFKELEEENYIPVSVFQSRARLVKELETADKTPILAVFRERNGHIEQLSINEDYIKDGGKELQSIMKNGLFEEIQPDATKEIEQIAPKNTLNKTSLDSATFTQVLDTVYNVGVPGDISKTPEEFHQAWNQYLDYAKQYNDKFDQIVAAAGKDHLLDTNSDFYKEWKQDHIYKENYHVRLQWSEDRPGGPKLPFKETELIDYQSFAKELYKANQSFYSLHQEGLKQVTGDHPEGYISPTKIQFSIYAPDGELIQDGIRYDIGDEINSIAHKERLGTREMREHPELMKIDGALFNQYHLERLASEQTIENIRDEFEKAQVKNSQNTPDNPYEKIYQYNRKDERDRDLDGDGISNSDEMLQGTDPYNAASNLHKKQEDRERRTDAEVAAGAIIIEEVATKNSEQTISQLIANKDTKALAEHLKEGMKNYLDSEQFKSFLDTMSKFHNYSLNNIHLLKMQNPNVSHVASFNKWKTDFERTVKKGSKALKIWVPYQVKTKISANQNELSFSPSENEMEEKEVTVTRFKLGNVFDVSQTEGKELPKAINELTGSVKDYEDLYRAAKAVSMDNQVSISFEEIKRESANGYYSPDENRIVVSKGLKGQEQILKTIFHEMAHSDLHRGTNAQYGDDQYRKQELQAESVAYVVANHFGFDTSSYSFGYLAIWAKDKNGFEDMVEQLQIVQKEAKSLIDRMDAKLELVKNKTVTKDKFADKLQQAKEKSEQLGSQKAEAVKQVEEKKSLSSPQ